MQRNIKCKLTQ